MVTQIEPDLCVHTWSIDAPNGPQSRGVCRGCGEERLFFNSFPELDRKNNSDIFAAGPRRGARDPEVYETTDRDLETALAGMRS